MVARDEVRALGGELFGGKGDGSMERKHSVEIESGFKIE